jgi:hypothetical protein
MDITVRGEDATVGDPRAELRSPDHDELVALGDPLQECSVCCAVAFTGGRDPVLAAVRGLNGSCYFHRSRISGLPHGPNLSSARTNGGVGSLSRSTGRRPPKCRDGVTIHAPK